MLAVTAFALTGSSQVVRAQPQGLYAGFSLRETGGTNPVTVRIFDNASAASGTLLDTVRLAANESARIIYDGGIMTAAGIFVEVSGTGTVEGSIRIA